MNAPPPWPPFPEHRVEKRFQGLEDCLRALATELALAQARIASLEVELGRRQADEQRARRLSGSPTRDWR